MATNLEYIFRLKDLYSRKLASITKQQIKFTEQYRRTMGKVNAASVKHQQLLKRTAQAYNINKQAMNRVNQQLEILTRKQGRYAREATRHISRLNMEWRKHGTIVQSAQKKSIKGKRGMGGGGLAGMAGGVGAGFAVRNIISTTASFQENMNMIEAVIKNVDMEKMTENALYWGRTTKFTAVEVSKAMGAAAKSGIGEIAVLAQMPGVLALAAAGQLDLTEAMDMTMNIVGQFNNEITTMKVADLLAAGASSARTSVTQLGQALRNTGQMAKLSGLDTKETLLALMALSEAGLKGDFGGTYMMNLLLRMKQMGTKLTKGFKIFLTGTGTKLSDFFNLKTGLFSDFNKFQTMLMEASPERLNALIKTFGARGVKAAGALAQLSGRRKAEFEDALFDVTGRAQSMADILMKGLPGALKLFNSAMETASIVMMGGFGGALNFVLRQLAIFLSWLQKNHSWVLTMAFALLTLVAAITAIGITAWVVVGSFTSLATVALSLRTAYIFLTGATWLFNAALWANPITWVVALVIALAAAFVYVWVKMDSFTEAMKLFGIVIIASLMEPANQVINVLRGLLYVLSLLPKWAGGDMFSKMQKDLTQMQKTTSKILYGSEVTSVFQLVDDLTTKKTGASTYLTSRAQRAINQRDEVARADIFKTGFDQILQQTESVQKATEQRKKWEQSSLFQIGSDFVNKGAGASDSLTSSSQKAAELRKKDRIQFKLDITAAVKADPGTELTNLEWIAETFGGVNLGPSMGQQ